LALSSEVKGGLAAAAVSLAAGIVALNGALVGVFYDDGLYAGLATALANGSGYVHPNLPGMPGGVHFPPLYPVVLAPLFGLLSVSSAAVAAKLLNAVLGAAAAGMIAWHAMRTQLLGGAAPRWLAPGIVTAAAIAIPVLATQSVLFAEPLFGVLVAIAIIATDRGQSPWIAGAAVALAFLTRSIAVAIVVGMVCFLIAPPRRPTLRTWSVLLLPVLVAALAWGTWVATHSRQIDPALALGYGTYLEPIRQAGASALLANVPDLSRPLEILAFGWIPVRWVYIVLSTLSLGIGLYGLVVLSRRSAIGYSLVFYLLILAVWPYPPDRFVWVVLPWLGLTWAAGGLEIWRRWPRARVAVGLLAALATGGFLYYEARGFAGRWWGTQARAISANFAELLPVVVTLPQAAVVATDNEALVWLYTRRLSVPLYLERYSGGDFIPPTAAEHRAYLERMGVTHVLLASASSPSAGELRRLMSAYPTWLTAVYRWSDGRWLFAVNRGQ
jgi:hypothetical protein